MSRFLKREQDACYPVKFECDCKRVFEIDNGWSNECPKCGAEYNGSGQRLAAREYWGEETGEAF